jgi:CRS1 / YhbY (CRM) domain.
MLATEKKNQNRDIETICRMTNSILINSIGNILIIYKENNQ